MKDKKILVVDFDEESLISLSNLIFEEGFQAVTAMDGLSGYEKFKGEDFDLVMIEPMLPKLHGFELMKRINQDSTRKIPIIVVTGIYREPSCKMEALQVYGASGYFTKPWNKDELRAKMLKLLVNGKESSIKKEKTAAPPPDKNPSASSPDDWGHLKKEPPRRESKAAKKLDDIEKELRAAVSGPGGSGRKKEPAKDSEKKKKEAKPDVNGEIEALLRGAIGGLGLDEKKKKSEPAKPEFKPPSRPAPPPPEPAAEPVPTPTTEPGDDILETIDNFETIPVIEEIKEQIPSQPKIVDHIPPAPPRSHFDAERTTRGIDQALIEIDKIPLDMGKEASESGRAIAEPARVEVEEKRVYFDDYAEPAKKKPPVGLIGGLAAAVLIIAGSTFIFIKSKKPSEPAGQVVSSVQPSLPSEFSQRQEEIPAASQNSQRTSPPAQKSALKPSPKKAAVLPPSPQGNSDSAIPVAPIIPEQAPALGLELQMETQTNSSAGAAGEERPQTDPPSQQGASLQVETPRSKPEVMAPPRVMAKPGDLVSLDSVDVAPVLLKKVDPKYPEQALNMGVAGIVTVNALISERGEVIRTEILKGVSGGYGLERAAETAILKWLFKPAEKDGVPVRVWKPLDINFKPNPSPNQ